MHIEIVGTASIDNSIPMATMVTRRIRNSRHPHIIIVSATQPNIQEIALKFEEQTFRKRLVK